MRQYEAMFLFDSTFAAEHADVEKEVERIMERAGAEIILTRKWEERRLAYEINKHKRGCYVLVYFRASPDGIGGIERDCKLAEHVLRVLILSAEDISREKMEQMATRVPSAARTGRFFDRKSEPSEPKEHRRDLDHESAAAGPRTDDDSKEAALDKESETVDAVTQTDDNKPSS